MKHKILICGLLSMGLAGCALMDELGLTSKNAQSTPGEQYIASEQDMKIEAMCIEATKNLDRANKNISVRLPLLRAYFLLRMYLVLVA